MMRASAILVLSVLLLLLAPSLAEAQEFNCSISVNYSQLSGSDFGFLAELEERIEEYMNERSWTDDRFLEHERLDCSMQLTVEEAISLTSFRSRLVVSLRRPIYNTTQNTTVVQLNDQNWQFNYVQGSPLVFDLERHDDLTSVINFYAFVLLGYDYDTFDDLGGTPHFRIARRIAERAQAQSAQGWSQIGNDRSRTNLITQLLDPRFRPLRRAYYDYHLNGLDRFVSDSDGARGTILQVVERMGLLFDELSRQYALDLFFSAKYTELAHVFQGSSRSSQAYDLLSRLDPAHLSDYQRLVQ